jgi:hypothetical protein
MNILRWILVLPVSFFGAVIGQLITLLTYFGLPDWITQIIGSSVVAACFVYFGFLMAPNHKNITTKILFYILTIIYISIFIISFYVSHNYSLWLLILNLIIGIGTAYETKNNLIEENQQKV